MHTAPRVQAAATATQVIVAPATAAAPVAATPESADDADGGGAEDPTQFDADDPEAFADGPPQLLPQVAELLWNLPALCSSLDAEPGPRIQPETASTPSSPLLLSPLNVSSTSLHMLLRYLQMACSGVSNSPRDASSSRPGTSAAATSSAPDFSRLWASRIEDAGSRAEKQATVADLAKEAEAKRTSALQVAEAAAMAAYPSDLLPSEHPLSSRYTGAAHLWPTLHAANFLCLDDLSLLLSVRPIALYLEELRQWRMAPARLTPAVASSAAASPAASTLASGARAPSLSLPRLRCSIPWFSLPSPLFIRILGVLATFTHTVPLLLAQLAPPAPLVQQPTRSAFNFDDSDGAPVDPTSFEAFCTADVLIDQLLHSDTLWQRVTGGRRREQTVASEAETDDTQLTEEQPAPDAEEAGASGLDEPFVIRSLLRHLYCSTQFHRTAHVEHLISSLRYDTAAVPTYPPAIADVDDAENQTGRTFDKHWTLMQTLLDGSRKILRADEDADPAASPAGAADAAADVPKPGASTICPRPSASAPLAALLDAAPLSLLHLFGCFNVLDALLSDLFRLRAATPSHRGCGLRVLNLHGCWALRSDTLAAVLSATPNLVELNLAFCARSLQLRKKAPSVQLGDDATPPSTSLLHPFESMALLRDLRSLDLTSCELDDAHMELFCNAIIRRVAADKALIEPPAAAAGESAAESNKLAIALSSVAIGSAADLVNTSASSRAASLQNAASSSSSSPKLSALNLANNSRLSNASLQFFHRAGLRLSDLCIYGDYRLDDKGLLELSYARLQRFNYCGAYRVTDGLKRFFISSNPNMIIYNRPQHFGAAADGVGGGAAAAKQLSQQERDTLAVLEGEQTCRCAHA